MFDFTRDLLKNKLKKLPIDIDELMVEETGYIPGIAVDTPLTELEFDLK